MSKYGLEVTDGDPAKLFKIVNKLGEGSYGSVYSAVDLRNGKEVAIKVLEVDSSELPELEREIHILKNCKHDNIVGYHGCYQKRNNIWIVMEFCQAGSVGDLMMVCNCTLSETQIKAVLKMSLIGLSYLHHKKLIHRDIKAANILLTRDGLCKLGDFGVSAELNNTIGKRKTAVGTPYWMSPEVLQSNEYDNKADIWSVGITCIELASGEPPHSSQHPMRALFLIPQSPPPTLPEPHKYSAEFHDFLTHCVEKDPSIRWSADQLLQHPFLSEMSDSIAKKVVTRMVGECIGEIEDFRAGETRDVPWTADNIVAISDPLNTPQAQNGTFDATTMLAEGLHHDISPGHNNGNDNNIFGSCDPDSTTVLQPQLSDAIRQATQRIGQHPIHTHQQQIHDKWNNNDNNSNNQEGTVVLSPTMQEKLRNINNTPIADPEYGDGTTVLHVDLVQQIRKETQQTQNIHSNNNTSSQQSTPTPPSNTHSNNSGSGLSSGLVHSHSHVGQKSRHGTMVLGDQQTAFLLAQASQPRDVSITTIQQPQQPSSSSSSRPLLPIPLPPSQDTKYASGHTNSNIGPGSHVAGSNVPAHTAGHNNLSIQINNPKVKTVSAPAPVTPSNSALSSFSYKMKGNGPPPVPQTATHASSSSSSSNLQHQSNTASSSSLSHQLQNNNNTTHPNTPHSSSYSTYTNTGTSYIDNQHTTTLPFAIVDGQVTLHSSKVTQNELAQNILSTSKDRNDVASLMRELENKRKEDIAALSAYYAQAKKELMKMI